MITAMVNSYLDFNRKSLTILEINRDYEIFISVILVPTQTSCLALFPSTFTTMNWWCYYQTQKLIVRMWHRS